MELSYSLKQAAASRLETWISYRRHLHQYPELSHEEFETTILIKKWLTESGITILPLDLPTGVLAEIKGEEAGPTIMLRADIDALPIKEEADVAFASKIDGKMHACGHDFHTVSMLAAAQLLQAQKQHIKGTIKILFQPAEETATGAKGVILAGAIEDVDMIFGMHNKPELPVGTVGVKVGPLMASVDRFEIEVTGRGGHAGIPDAAIDPVIVSSAIVTALQTIVSRSTSPKHAAVVSVTKLQAGNTWNVIPDKACLEGTVRTFEAAARDMIPQQMERIVQSTAASYGASATFIWHSMLPAINNDELATMLIKQVAEKQQLEIVEAEPTMGGEDFALYQEHIPGSFIWMGTSGSEQWHHPKFTLDEQAIAVSAALFAETAIFTSQQVNHTYK